MINVIYIRNIMLIMHVKDVLQVFLNHCEPAPYRPITIYVSLICLLAYKNGSSFFSKYNSQFQNLGLIVYVIV